MKWTIAVTEEDDTYFYHYYTWAEVIAKLATFDGLAVEYSIYGR